MLDLAWVDRIHARLLVRYGSAWIAKFQSVDERLVKQDWAEQLSGIRPEAIKHALDHLPPEFPPTVTQFRGLCLRAPDAPMAKLPPPKSDPAVAASALSAVQRPKASDSKAWAYRLRDREMAKDRLSMAQRTMWREALGVSA